MNSQTKSVSNTEAGRLATAPQQFTPLELETRPTVDTAAAAHYLHLAKQTLRIFACKECGPIRPRRIPGSSKLHWVTNDIRKLLGVAPTQSGFISLAYLAFLVGAFVLLQVILTAWPGILNSLDWAGVAALGAGVIGNSRSMSRRHSAESKLQKPDDPHGLCPECHAEPEILNVGRNHHGVCHTHKLYWLIGSNLFSGWRDEDPATWKSNELVLDTYKEANPFFYPPKPVLIVTKNPNRPPPVTPLQFLKEVTERLQVDAERNLTGCTRIGVFSQGFWWGVRDSAPDEFQIAIEATTAFFEESDAVSIFIRKDLPVATARDILKAAVQALKGMDSLEHFTPLHQHDGATDDIVF